MTQEEIARRRMLSLILTFVLGLSPLLIRVPFWSQKLRLMAPGGLDLMGLCLGAASIGLALWQWYSLKTNPGPKGLNRATVRMSWIPIVLYALSGAALIVTGFIGISQGLGLGLAFVGVAVAFRLFQLDVLAKV